MPADLTPLEEDLLATLDRRELARYRQVLGGFPADARDHEMPHGAEGYIQGKLRAWQIPFAVQRFEAAISLPGEASFTLARRNAPVPALAQPYSASTPPAGIVADLRPATDAARDLTGAIALIEGQPDPAAVARLAARGAIALVSISPDDELRPAPVPDAWGQPVPLPVITIARAAGEGFQALCTAGPTAVRLTAMAAWHTRSVHVTVATVAGGDEPHDYVLAGAALPPATAISGDAAACLLELCRVAALHSGRLRRGLRCVWWPGEALPLAPLWYTDQHWSDLAHHAWGHVGLYEAARDPGVSGWAEVHLRHFAEAALRDGDASRPRWSPDTPFADIAPFARLGLPSLALTTRPESFPTLLPLIARLCTVPLPPIDLPALTRAIQAQLAATLDRLGDRLDLGPLRDRAAVLHTAAERLQIALLHLAQADSTNDEEGIALANRLIRQLHQRLLPALRHPGDPHAAMPTTIDAPIPGLAPALAYVALPEPRTGQEAFGLRAAAIRERNRLLATFDAATDAIDDALTALRPLGFG